MSKATKITEAADAIAFLTDFICSTGSIRNHLSSQSETSLELRSQSFVYQVECGLDTHAIIIRREEDHEVVFCHEWKATEQFQNPEFELAEPVCQLASLVTLNLFQMCLNDQEVMH